ncbi:MAG: type II secretion system minor pseudopilin GspK [Desulfobacterales bacterium]|nr:type II secretion system minor pseudopilin GspK [Desulfobacterales bacterium]
MRKFLRNSRGVALILTIMIVGLIVALTIQFNRDMRAHVVSTGNIGHGLKALYAAKSGTSCGLGMLMEDSQEVDTLSDLWAVDDNLAGISAGSQALFPGGRFKLKIEDLSGKIQINSLVNKDGNYDIEQQDVLTRFLSLKEFGLETEEADDIVAAIKDWIDTDGDVTSFGAEDDYYRSLERPYHCKNGQLDSPEELLLVKGITRELFYGTEGRPGISAYISVFGDGKININTADIMVLKSLHDEMNVMADLVVEERNKDTTDLSGQWFTTFITDPMQYVVLKSRYFRITSDGYTGKIMRRAVAVVERKKEDFQTLSWKIE